MMWKYLGSEGKEIIEDDDQFSKANYRSRKNYSIESAILEKRLIIDSIILSMKPTICNLTDL